CLPQCLPHTAATHDPARRSTRSTTVRTRGLTLGEAAVGGALVIVAAIAWSSLALATLGRHSLPAVVGLALALLLPVGFALRRTPVRVLGSEALCLAALCGLCLWCYLPGWF